MKVFVILGPTAVGKTELSLTLAEYLGSPIISADSRQMFRDIPIGTAAPTAEEQSRVHHYFVGNLGLEDNYNASQFEKDSLALLDTLPGPAALVSGGSMLYIDALCNGIDEMPDILPDIRENLRLRYEENGLECLVAELRLLDPQYFAQCDLRNQVRVIHALEICYQTGRPFSSFRRKEKKARPHEFIKIGLTRPREELFDRINRRVDIMVKNGFIAEARRVFPFKHLNSLNTVGFKEIFQYINGEWELPFALDRMRKNTRVYAKKQMTWFQRDADIHWFHPDDKEAILEFVKTKLNESGN